MIGAGKMELSQELLRVMEKQIDANTELTGEVSKLREHITILTGKLSNGTLGGISSCVSDNSKKLDSLRIVNIGIILSLVGVVVKLIVG